MSISDSIVSFGFSLTLSINSSSSLTDLLYCSSVRRVETTLDTVGQTLMVAAKFGVKFVMLLPSICLYRILCGLKYVEYICVFSCKQHTRSAWLYCLQY